MKKQMNTKQMNAKTNLHENKQTSKQIKTQKQKNTKTNEHQNK